MKSFVAIDFETANQYRSSVCSVGLVFVENLKIIDSFMNLFVLHRIFIVVGQLIFMVYNIGILKMPLSFRMFGKRFIPR